MFYHVFIGRRSKDNFNTKEWAKKMNVYPHCRSVVQDRDSIRIIRQNGDELVLTNRYFYLAQVEAVKADEPTITIGNMVVRVKEWAEVD